ncbi:MAG: hypothetical protein JKY99_00245 [Rhizobiales bacterium]|nr:hypothetical protein [Hyphomicrobiales bacterium]
MIVAKSSHADAHLILVTSQNNSDNVVGRALNFMSHRILLDQVNDFDDALKMTIEGSANTGNVPIMVLIDLQLPTHQRARFIAALRKDKATEKIPIIGLADPYNWDNSLAGTKSGINVVVPMKRDPMQYQELSEIITEYWFSKDFITASN